MTAPGPPGLARRLLAATLTPTVADDVLANLEDLHGARVFRRGRLRADLWYWGQAVSFAARLRWAGRTAVHEPPMKGTSLMRSILQDLRFAWRQYRSRPGFALSAVSSLAIAIGFNTAVFSLVDGVLLRPAPLADMDRLVIAWETDRNTGTTREPASVPDFVDYRAATRTLDALGALIAQEVTLTPPGGEPSRLAALFVSHDLLPLVGITARAGRPFGRDDERADRRVAIVSESLSTRLFGNGTAAVGRALVLDDELVELVGVVPDATDFGVLQVLGAAAYSRSFADRGTPVRVDVWLPLVPDPDSLPRSTHPAFMIGRLAPGRSIADAQGELAELASGLETAYPRDNTGRGINLEPLSAVVFGPVRPAFLALLGAVGLVLLVACANVVNLLLAEGASRRREVGVRIALGASRLRLTRQFLTETMALALVASALGVALAYASLGWLVSLGPADVPRLSDASIDLRVLSVALAATLAIGLVFGLVPTLQAGRTAEALAGARTVAGGRHGARVRAALVVAELSLSVMLVAGAGLLVRSFLRLQAIDLGFETVNIVKAEYQLPASRYPVDFRVWPDFKEQHAFTRALLDRARRLPGVEAAAIAGNHPLDPGFTNSWTVVGREAEAATWPEISVRRVTEGYFDTVGVPLVEGRAIEAGDTTSSAPVVVINEAARARFFPDGPAIGHEVRLWGTARRIVGIVGNEKFQGLTAAAPIALYAPLSQTPSTSGAGVLLARSSGSSGAIASALPRVVREIDPRLAVFGVEALDEALTRSTAAARFTLTLVAVFAAMALGLAALGVHGVLSYLVNQRAREIGIRMALGARPERLRNAVIGRGLALAAAGIGLGLATTLAFSRAFAALLYEVPANDPATFTAVAALLFLVAGVACLVPARAATRVDPARTLRAD